jgi:hypothetical protein
MTNTLHRYGKPEDLKDDYIVFIIAARGINEEGAGEKVHAFLEAALKYKPVNMGSGIAAPLHRPEKDLNFIRLYFSGRKESLTPEELLQEPDRPNDAAVVFDNKGAMAGFLKEVSDLDLGLSVNASALVEDVRQVCRKNGIAIHSVEYSLGFHGATDRLPERHVLALTTMCGHGMISADFARKMVVQVREARVTPEKAAGYMAKFCVCGVFNTARAIRILKEARMSN